MALKAGRVGVRPDQVDAQGYIIGTTPGPTPSAGHTYSLTEQEIGTWIDGKKIYEIVAPITEHTAVLNIEGDIDEVIYTNAIGGHDRPDISTDSTWTLNSTSGFNNRSISVTLSTKTVMVGPASPSPAVAYSCKYVIVQYTKKEES